LNVSYYDITNSRLKYAYFQNGSWEKEVVDDENSVGQYSSLFIDALSRKNISYYNATNGSLMYAGWLPNNLWTVNLDTVDTDDDVGTYNHLQFDHLNRLNVGYYDATHTAVKYAVFQNNQWSKEWVDTSRSVGQYTSIAIDNLGRKNISYYNATNGSLMYAGWLNNNLWNISNEIIDTEGDVGQHNSLTLNHLGRPAVSYYDLSNTSLKFAFWHNNQWYKENVDTANSVGQYSSLAIDNIGRNNISYYNATNGSLMYVGRLNNNLWNISKEIIDTDGDVGQYNALHLNENLLDVSYYDATNQQLKYAYKVGSNWLNEVVDSSGNVGQHTSLNYSYISENLISYYDVTNSALKFAQFYGNRTLVSGLVTDSITGQPIPNAEVRLVPVATGGMARTDSLGHWYMSAISGIGYELHIIKSGYRYIQEDNVTFEEGTLDTLQHMMAPGPMFSEYRIIRVAQAPNPDTLEIPQGGTGYAWFVVEGSYGSGVWLPAWDIELQAADEQSNLIKCVANWLPYQFLTSLYHMQNAGVFAIPIHSYQIGEGNPGEQEIFTIVLAEGIPIAPSLQDSILAKVIPYKYTQTWGYRIYGKVGVGTGAATGGIVKANAFAGGGSGAMLKLQLQGLDENPTWSQFQIYRKNDLFLGANVSVGPPSLIKTNLTGNVGVSAGVKQSFPYQTEFDFDMNSLQGLEPLMAFYLFYEPSILYAGTKLPGGQIGINFLSWMVQVLIANSAQNGLGVLRTADVSGLDIEGSINASAAIGIGDPKGLSLSAGASLGVKTHIGTTLKQTYDSITIRKFYIGGGYDATFKVGPKFVGDNKLQAKFIYPFRLKHSYIPSKLDVQFECANQWKHDIWDNVKLTASLESNSQLLNIYHLSGARQQYNASLVIDNEDAKNILLNVAEIPSEVWNIGTQAVSFIADDNSFNDDINNYLEAVYEEQNDDQPVLLGYSFDAIDKNEFNLDMEVQFPIPVFPALDIVIGGGLSASWTREYELANGFWSKALPYYQIEMDSLPKPQVTFFEVMTELWDRVIAGDPLAELVDVIVSQLAQSKYLRWIVSKSVSQTIELNSQGSSITILENSIPPEYDSIFCRQWEWGEEPTNRSLSPEKALAVKKYVQTLRVLREEATGLHYGIGGFFRFEPVGGSFGDSTLLTIAYLESDVIGYDESELKMFWEDSLGIWHPLPSTVNLDSNKVSAWIEKFATYTLAPKLPQGSYGFNADPDSIPSDGYSIALLTSDTILYNDSTMINDSSLFTVQLNRGVIIAIDADTTKEGIQVMTQSGIIQFQVQADSIPSPIEVIAKSAEGFAYCETNLILFDTVPPNIPQVLSALADNKGIQLNWIPNTEPDLAGYKIYFDTDSINPPFNGISTVWGDPSPVFVGETDHHLVTGLFNDTTYQIAITAIDISGNESGYSNIISTTPNFGRSVSIKIFLEGPFGYTNMSHDLNDLGLIPIYQPYNIDPWNYMENDSVSVIPNDSIVDWILLELRETGKGADSAKEQTIIYKQAAFLLSNGNVVGLNGSALPKILVSLNDDVYLVIWHRNHLNVMSSNPLPLINGAYTIDFTNSPANTHNGGIKDIGNGLFVMYAGDVDSNGDIIGSDQTIWRENMNAQPGRSNFYNEADINLDGQINSVDHELWKINNGTSTQTPQK